MMDPVKPKKKNKEKLVDVINQSAGILFEPDTADRLFGVSGETPAPINFGKYHRFFKESGNTVGGARSIAQVGTHYNDKAYKDIIYPYLKELNPGMKFNYAVGGQTDPPGLLQQYFEATDNPADMFPKLGEHLSTLAEVESFSGKRMKSDKSSGKGYYHYIDDAVKTVDNRIKAMIKKHNIKGDLKKQLMDSLELPVQERPRDVQDIMVLTDYMIKPEAPYQAWLKGEVDDKELYYKGHHGVSPKAISSQDKVYENWDNAISRLQEGTQYGDGGFAKFMSNAGASMMDAAGGLPGLIGMGAGVGADLLKTLLGDSGSYNAAGTSVADFDFNADWSREQGQRKEKFEGTLDAIGGTLGEIPIIGGGIDLLTQGIKGISRLFGGGPSQKGLRNDYMGVFLPENMARRKSMYNYAFGQDQAEYGGLFDSGLIDPELQNAGVYKVGVGGTHQENPQGGVTFGMGGGTPDKAEEGEVIIDGPQGNKLVFTNKF